MGRWIHHSLVHRFPEDSFSYRVRFYNGKYTAQKSKEDWTGDEVSVEFEVINGRVEENTVTNRDNMMENLVNLADL